MPIKKKTVKKINVKSFDTAKKKVIELEADKTAETELTEILEEEKSKVESWRNDQNMNAMSGSEMMMIELEKRLGEEFLEDFQIILSRVRELDETKIRILWLHDLPNDNESIKALDNEGWKNFHRLVFVSNWQMQYYIERFSIPWSHCVVMKNAINPIQLDPSKKFDRRVERDCINFIYHTTPHRGLGLMVPVFKKLVEDYGEDALHLDVYSNFDLYGWPERNKEFEALYEAIRTDKSMTYHGTVSNTEVRKALEKADVFAYPSVWTETSCIALIEAMSASLMCVHSNLGALYETAGHWTFMYPFQENPSIHASTMYEMLRHTIDLLQEDHESLRNKLYGQKAFADTTFTWEVRENEWKAFLDSTRLADRSLPKSVNKNEDIFSYEVNM